jgi:hypothetical protein
MLSLVPYVENECKYIKDKDVFLDQWLTTRNGYICNICPHVKTCIAERTISWKLKETEHENSINIGRSKSVND